MSPSPEDFRTQADDIYPGSISTQEYEEILRLGSEFVGLDGDYRMFVLGSYGDVKEQRLIDVMDVIGSYPHASCEPFRMDEILKSKDGLNGILKCRLLAKFADHIILICEDQVGGTAIEQGMLVSLPEYLDKSHLCKRSYPNDLEKQRYSWMQSKGVFQLYEEVGHLVTWETSDGLTTCVENILGRVTS